MKAIWKGSLSFGLVSIRVELFSAIKHHALDFHMLHSTCHTPINYQKICPKDHKILTSREIVKGIKKDEHYVVFTEDELKKFKPLKTEILDILEFVEIDTISPIFYADHYYILPSRGYEKAFFLLLSALDKQHKAAIGTLIMHDKEHVCSIQADGNILLCNTLNYAYEIREITRSVTKPKVSVKEQQLAEELVKKLSVKKFDISAFKDTFAQEVVKELSKPQQRKKGAKIVKKKKNPVETSLAANLQASLKRSPKEIRAYAKRR